MTVFCIVMLVRRSPRILIRLLCRPFLAEHATVVVASGILCSGQVLVSSNTAQPRTVRQRVNPRVAKQGKYSPRAEQNCGHKSHRATQSGNERPSDAMFYDIHPRDCQSKSRKFVKSIALTDSHTHQMRRNPTVLILCVSIDPSCCSIRTPAVWTAGSREILKRVIETQFQNRADRICSTHENPVTPLRKNNPTHTRRRGAAAAKLENGRVRSRVTEICRMMDPETH